MAYLFTRFEDCSFTHLNNVMGPKKYKNWSCLWPHRLWVFCYPKAY